jgi:RHS repeat-associated protein
MPTATQNQTVVEYDDNGNVTKRTFKDQTQDSGIEADKDIVVEYVFDARSRLLTRKDKIGASTYANTVFAYGKRDNLTKVTDPEGDIVNTEYNEKLWKTKVTQETSGDDVITEYVYDDDGRTLTYRAKNSTTGDQETKYTYDLEGLKVTTEWPDTEKTLQTYDLAGQRISTTDPIGTVVVRGYDADRRMTSIDVTKGTNVVGMTAIDYGYDALGRVTSADTTEGSFSSVVERDYNTLGKMESETQIIDGWNSGAGRTITYGWNVAGQKTSVIYPVSGDSITYTRDELDRVDTVSRNSTEIVDYAFNGKRVIEKAFPGSVAEMTYDTFGRLTQIHHEDTSSTNTLLDLDYGYDDSHRVTHMDKTFYDDVANTRITANTDDLGDQYAYDGAGKLVTVLRGVPTAKITTAMATNISNTDYVEKMGYVYDQTGNRLTRQLNGSSDTTYEHNKVNEMTKEDTSTLSYDKSGNFEGVSNAYKYDWRNQIAYHDTGSRQYTYRYDAFGRMVQRDRAGTTVAPRTYFDGNQLIEKVTYEATPDAEIHKKTYVFGERIDELLMFVDVGASPDVEAFSHADKLGSIMLLVDSGGAIQESYRYKEWGELTILDGSFVRQSQGAASPIGNPFMYTGQKYARMLAASGEEWYDYRARHLRADAGRFVQRDPLGYGDGANPYYYVKLGPLSWTDPLGLAAYCGGPSVSFGDGDFSGGVGVHGEEKCTKILPAGPHPYDVVKKANCDLKIPNPDAGEGWLGPMPDPGLWCEVDTIYMSCGGQNYQLDVQGAQGDGLLWWKTDPGQCTIFGCGRNGEPPYAHCCQEGRCWTVAASPL